ncbi:7-carboxy-7-deazaguanine synthase [Clostridium sp. CAG:632]|nr:putative 7-carboxy-7-deazaguanine synthase QueE [Clostridium sp.]CCY57627.1 7-carboxy-7-deazaguanine synthase [Clostridium sp. CAG:632]
MIYKVVETFISINGEGQHAGELALFIRFAGCNLNCNYCDTRWANQPDVVYQEMTETEIKALVTDSGVRNVTLTGGEPLLQPGMYQLLETMGSLPDIRIEIETNGSVDIGPYMTLIRRPAFTLDYKLPGSGMEAGMNTENYRYLTKEDTVKFVISDKADLTRAREIIEQYQLEGRCGIYYSPVFGRIRPAEIVDDMIEHRLNGVHMQLQMHKFIWDPEQRGV